MHTIEPNADTLHGYFSRERDPVLTIDSGESVRFRTLDASWRYVEGDELVQFTDVSEEEREAHALCGPVAINDAKAGMTLEISIDAIEVDKLGWNIGGGGNTDLWKRLGVSDEPFHLVHWTLDAEAGTGRNSTGQTVNLAPFMGVMGMPPDEPGKLITSPPRYSGGNIDCKSLIVGSKLFLPIAVDGGLFSVGDGHAAQGDGEVSGTAIECPMKRVDLTFTLHQEMSITTPRANTPEGWLTFGFHSDLDEAAFIALNAMLDWLMIQYQLSRKDALSLASVVVDLRVTQIVNGVKGVHALLPHGAIS